MNPPKSNTCSTTRRPCCFRIAVTTVTPAIELCPAWHRITTVLIVYIDEFERDSSYHVGAAVAEIRTWDRMSQVQILSPRLREFRQSAAISAGTS